MIQRHSFVEVLVGESLRCLAGEASYGGEREHRGWSMFLDFYPQSSVPISQPPFRDRVKTSAHHFNGELRLALKLFFYSYLWRSLSIYGLAAIKIGSHM